MVKNLDDMKRLVDMTLAEHKRNFKTTLTKKDLRSAVGKALESKRQKWIEARVSDHSIAELQTLLEAIDKTNTTSKQKNTPKVEKINKPLSLMDIMTGKSNVK